VADDGVGFALPQRPDYFTPVGHFGRVGMQERATRLSGTFQVRAAPGEGTQVTVTCLPCPLLQMLSVHDTTGQIRHHTWHSEFIQMLKHDAEH